MITRDATPGTTGTPDDTAVAEILNELEAANLSPGEGTNDLQRLALLAAPAEEAFDRLTRLATKIVHAPAALLSLVVGDRSFFKSSVGLPEQWDARREMPLSNSVCQHVIATNGPLVINDARADPLVSDNQAVADLSIVAYLGIPLVTTDGQVLGTFAVIDTVPREWTSEDITTLGDLAASAITEIELRAESNQRLQMEQRLHLLESAVSHATAAVVITEADPTDPSDPSIVFANDAYMRLSGYSAKEIVGQSHRILNSSLSDPTQIDTIKSALAASKPARLECLSHRKDGSTFWSELNIIPIADKAGKYSHWVVIQRDISGDKSAKEALRFSEARWQAILEAAPDCVIAVDSSERITEFNGVAERTFGYTHDQAIGKPLVELIVPPGDGAADTMKIGQYLSAKTRFRQEKHVEIDAVRADGTTFPAEVAFATIRAEVPVFAIFLRDITERKREAFAATASGYRPSWLSLNFFLAGCVAFTLFAALYLNGRLVSLHAESVKINRAWGERANRYLDLGLLASMLQLAGNEVFASRDVEAEAAKVAEYSAQFEKALSAERAELQKNLPESQSKLLLARLEVVADCAHRIVAEAEKIFAFFREGQIDQAADKMVTMNREYFAFRDARRHLAHEVRRIEQEFFEDQARTTAQTSFWQYGFGVLMLLLVTGVVIDAFRLSRQVKSAARTAAYNLAVIRASEESLRRGEAQIRRLALVAERTDNAVVLTDSQGRIEWVNAGFTRIGEYELAEVRGKTPGSVLQGPKTDPATVALMHERRAMGQAYQVEVLNYAKSGRSYWVALDVQPIRDELGSLTGFMAVSNDISARKKSEETSKEVNQQLEDRVALRTTELSEANEFMKALLENVQDGIAACDANGELTMYNRTIRSFGAGTNDLEVGDRSIVVPVPTAEWAAAYGLYQSDGKTLLAENELPLIRALRGERVQNLEMVIAPKGGTPRTLLASGRAFFNDRGEKLGAVVSMNDITEQKHIEAERLDAHDRLERRVEERTNELNLAKQVAQGANRAKSEFFSRMNHELRTPLNVILGFGQLLEMEELDESQRESADQILKAGRHLLSLINEVLDIARIEAGEGGMLSPEEVHVKDSIGDVLSMIQPLANQARIKLIGPTAESANRSVLADLQRFKQVLMNLLSNAIKYNREDGTISITCTDAGTMLRISVTDTGHGVPPENLHRLFAPFDRLDADRTDVQGTGLGLTLSKGLVEAMHGTMGVESRVGIGSTFWFELPSINSHDIKTIEHNGAAEGHAAVSTTTGTVLYIEDNPANFRLVERILKLRPRVVLLSAMLGRLGIDLAREHRPNLIVLDLNLPDLHGSEVLTILKEDARTRDLPVVILSADATPNQIERLIAQGATRYLVKPLDVKELLATLDEHLNLEAR